MVRAHIDAKQAQKAYENVSSSPRYNTQPFPTVPLKTNFDSWKNKFTDQRDSNFLFATYHPDKITDTIKEMRDNNWLVFMGGLLVKYIIKSVSWCL